MAVLADILTEFAHSMATDSSIQVSLDRLLGRLVESLPVTAVGLTMSGLFGRWVAGAGPEGVPYELLQQEIDDGPGLTAFRIGSAISVTDFALDRRFDAFGRITRHTGLRAAFAFPMRHGARPIGALVLYRDTPGELDPVVAAAARIVSEVATASLATAAGRSPQVPTRSDESPPAGIALLSIDLDRGARGEQQNRGGDQLLSLVAQRLAALLPAAGAITRTAADRFLIVCPEMADAPEADALGAACLAALAEPFLVGGTTLATTASVGIAFAPHEVSGSDRLQRHADSALHRAKQHGGNRLQRYGSDQQQPTEVCTEADLLRALDSGQLTNAYQPIVAIRDGRIRGFEALLRWQRPPQGPVSPIDLIPLAERWGLINPIGFQVLAGAWSERGRWAGPAAEPLSVAVNVSAQQLMSAGYARTVAGVLDADPAIDPGLLVLEVTETVFLDTRALTVLRDLKDLGVQLALDDFGTGYSSLSYLRQFPVDIIKIDRSFVIDLVHDSTSRAIVTAVIDLAHALGMQVVAEGVETAAQLEVVSELGADSYQGYYFARPMAAEDVDILLRDPLPRGAGVPTGDPRPVIPQQPRPADRCRLAGSVGGE